MSFLYTIAKPLVKLVGLKKMFEGSKEDLY